MLRDVFIIIGSYWRVISWIYNALRARLGHNSLHNALNLPCVFQLYGYCAWLNDLLTSNAAKLCKTQRPSNTSWKPHQWCIKNIYNECTRIMDGPISLCATINLVPIRSIAHLLKLGASVNLAFCDFPKMPFKWRLYWSTSRKLGHH